MASSTLKFGPEWLRNLSDGSVSSIPSSTSSSSTSNSVAAHGPSSQAAGISTTQKYKLADYRYGREEMLALFAAPIPVPENLKELKVILSDRLQQPMALQPETDDEQHLFSQPVNSTAVLRMTGRGSAAPLGGLRGDVDRGRGRGRGRSEVGGFYSRVPIEEDSFSRGSRLPRDGHEADSRGRGFGYMGRSFDDMSTSSSSHGEFSRSMSTENWRMSRKYEDNEGSWRKPSQRSTSRRWREPWEKSSDVDRERMLDRRMSEDSYRDRSVPSYRRSISSNSAYDEEADPLPEWSIDDVDDIGTFDSSGAFMSLKELEQQEKKERKSQEADSQRDEEEADGSVSAMEKESTIRESEAESNAIGADTAASDTTDKDAPAQHQQQPAVEPASSDNSCTQADDMPKASEVPKPGDTTDGAGQQPVDDAIASDKPANEDGLALAVEPESNGTCAAGEGQEAEVNFDHLELQVENLYASMSADEEPLSTKEKGFLPPDHEDAKKWFYRDPQGQVQGPFSSGEMAEWFSAGYFSMNLVVKQGADECFVPLGELIKKMGSVPFIAAAPVKISPPLSTSTTDMQHHQDQLKLLLLQQQQQQQQQQLQQQLRTVQTQEAFAKLTPQQQQQLLLQVMLKQQLNPQVAAAPVSQQQQQKTNALNRSALLDTMNAFQRLSSTVSSHPSASAPSFHRSMSQPSGIDVSSIPSSLLYGLSTSAAGTANNLPSVAMPTAGATWRSSSCMPSASGTSWMSEAGTGPGGLWNVELPKAITASALEEMQYLVLEKAHQQQRQQQIPTPVSATGLREPHQMKLQELLEARAGAEKSRDANGAMGIDQLRELLQQHKQQVDIVRLAEEQRRLLEDKRRMLEMNPLDRQRLVRQDRSEELYRQQQLDSLCRLQTDPITSSLQDRDAMDVRQLLALQQTWASSHNRGQMVPSGAGLGTPSTSALFHHKDNGTSSSSSAAAASIIQQELINKHLKLNDVKTTMNQWPLSSGASASRWANESGTWTGTSLAPSKSSSLNWETAAAAAVSASNKSINSSVPFMPGGLPSQMKQEFVQKVHKSKEELTHWCENVLKGMLTCSSMDIPTFICHLMDLSSALEVNHFVQAYLGDTDDAKKFVKQFVEKQNRIQQEALIMQYMSSGSGNPW